MNKESITVRNAAVISGLGLLIMAVLAALANFQVVETAKSAIAEGDQGGILAVLSEPGRWAVLAFVIVAMLDVLVAWSLNELFRVEQRALSLLAAWFRLLYTAVFAVSIIALSFSFRMAGEDTLIALKVFKFFEDAWMFGLIFFAVHLGLLGWLMLRSSFVHWIFGVLSLVAAVGYLVDGVAFLLNPDTGVGLAVFTFIGEVVFIFWLLIRGPRLEANNRRDDYK